MIGFRWMPSIRKASSTTSILIFGEQRSLRSIKPFHLNLLYKYARKIESWFFNGRRVFEQQVLQLVSKYSEKKETDTQLIFFHPRKNWLNSIIYCILVWKNWLNSIVYCILVWKTDIRTTNSTTYIQILRKERGLRPIHSFSSILFEKIFFTCFWLSLKKYLMLIKWFNLFIFVWKMRFLR